MRTTRSDFDRESQSSEGHAAKQKRLCRACKWVQALAPTSSWKKTWEEEVLSLSICLSIHLSHTTKTSTLSRIKCERYIFIKKCVRSFIEVRKLCFIMFPLIFVLRLYNSNTKVNDSISDTKRNTIVGNGSFLWPELRDYHVTFQVVRLSIPFVPTSCLKDPWMGMVQFIRNFF